MSEYASNPPKEHRAFKATGKTILQIFCKKQEHFRSSARNRDFVRVW